MRIQKVLFLILFSTISIVVYGQEQQTSTNDSPKSYISIGGGVSIPIGDFATFDTLPLGALGNSYFGEYNLAGEAKTGLLWKISAGYSFSKHFGIAGMFYSGSNKGNSNLGNKILGVSATNKVDSWKQSGFLLGLSADIPFPGLTLGFRLMGGLQNSISPEASVTLQHYDYSGFHTDTYAQPEMSSLNFVFCEAIDVRIRAGKKIGFVIGFEHITSHAAFSDEIEITLESYNLITSEQWSFNDTQQVFYEKQFSIITVNLGIAYLFN